MVNVATDDLDYFAAIEAVFARSGTFTRTEPEPLPEAARTEFETIFLAQNKSIGRARYLLRD